MGICGAGPCLGVHCNPACDPGGSKGSSGGSVSPFPGRRGSGRYGSRVSISAEANDRIRPVADVEASMSNGRMEATPSTRIIDQRVRNRIMEELLGLAEGDENVRRIGAGEYFEAFYDWVSHRGDGVRPNSALTPDEAALILKVSIAVDEACDATPKIVSAKELIATDWPERIKPLARSALDEMLRRGRFSEQVEEAEPSTPVPWP